MTGIKCSYPFFSSIRISPDSILLSKLNTAEKSIPHLTRDPCLSAVLSLTLICHSVDVYYPRLNDGAYLFLVACFI